MYSYTAQDSDELSFQADEKIIKLTEPRSRDWFTGKNQTGIVGLCPIEYFNCSWKSTPRRLNYGNESNVVALFPYSAADTDELSLEVGDRILKGLVII